MNLVTREEAYELFASYNKTDSLLKHGLAVEGVMRHFATLYKGENPDEWGIIGLVHDLDYEMYPDEHCQKTKEILEANNWSDESIRVIMSHGYEICTDVEPIKDIEKVLYTVDELTGLIVATALMRPSKSLSDLTVKSVMKKWKTKSFAAGVNRDLISKGADKLGMTIQEVINECIIGMRVISDSIGL